MNRVMNRTIKAYGFGMLTKEKEKKNKQKQNQKSLSTDFSTNTLENMFKTFIDFKKQLGREQVKKNESKGANEARFSYLSKPCKVLGSYHRLNSPDFGKMLPHNNDGILLKNMNVIYYAAAQPAYLSSLKSGCNI